MLCKLVIEKASLSCRNYKYNNLIVISPTDETYREGKNILNYAGTILRPYQYNLLIF
jgi:hypothetical protein